MLVKREKYNLDSDIGLIPLGDLKFAIVDAADYESLSRYKWYAHKSRHCTYAARNTHIHGKDVVIFMHRQIMRFPKGKHVHHSNHNTLDNRRCNLLVTTPATHKILHYSA